MQQTLFPLSFLKEKKQIKKEKKKNIYTSQDKLEIISRSIYTGMFGLD